MVDCNIAIIGAGPAGTVCAKFLKDAGLSVTILEAQEFPRFVIGESLLPSCMNTLEKCGLVDAINQAGFQFKNGAVFERGDQYMAIDFRNNFERTGWGTSLQVQRAQFDQILADEVISAGVDIHFGHKVTGASLRDGDCCLSFRDNQGNDGQLSSLFVVDASGYGRVLPRMMGVAKSSTLIERRALFTHMREHIDDANYDREKILITVHPTRQDIWYWLIPFSNGTVSVGVIYPDDAAFAGMEDAVIFQQLLDDTALGRLLARAEHIRNLTSIAGYSTQSENFFGEGYVLLGNAAGFIDPIFSSGVAIAMHSAELAAMVLIARHNHHPADWQDDFATPLSHGIATFRSYVDAWYNGKLQSIIFNKSAADVRLKRMVVSILAGYAWNMENPLVAKTDRYLDMLHTLCATPS